MVNITDNLLELRVENAIFAPIPLQRVTPSSRSSRSSDHRRSRDDSPEYDRREGRNVSLRYSDDRDY
ncbi:hypothetical protein Tco_1514192 [Tanacetum coccineum]